MFGDLTAVIPGVISSASSSNSSDHSASSVEPSSVFRQEKNGDIQLNTVQPWLANGGAATISSWDAFRRSHLKGLEILANIKQPD